MRKSNRIRNFFYRFKTGSIALLFLITQLIFVASASGIASAATPAANDWQCVNGSLTKPADCTSSSDWVNGNSNSTKSHYREGDSIPYRVVFSNLTTGTHTFTFSYRTTKVKTNSPGSGHAIDYLTSYNATVTNANPCVGVSTCNSAPNLYPIPKDPNVASAGVKQEPGNFAMFNGSITAVSPYSLSGPYSGTSSTTLTITFHYDSSQPDPVFAWGGHIASEIDWGLGNGASGISGSPYHTWEDDLDGNTIGAEDMQLMASSILPIPNIMTIVSSANPYVGSSVTDTANLSGPLSPLSGSVDFYICGPGAITSCYANNGGTQVGTSVPVSPGNASTGSAVSAPYQITQVGTYCFGAIYTPDATAAYSPIDETNFTQECFTATIPNSTIEIIKDANPISSQSFTFNTSTNLGTSSFNLTDNGTTGANVKTFSAVVPGVYTITEAPTVGWDFTSLNCGSASAVINGATVTINITGGQSVVCTYTNTEKGSITVKKIVNNGLGNLSYPTSGWYWNLNGAGGYTDGGTSVPVSAGQYTVSEALTSTQNAEYHVTASSCNNVSTSPASTSQSFTVAPGENVTCYFTNTRDTGTMTVFKTLVPYNDSGRFDLHINGPTPDTAYDKGNNGTTGPQTVVTGSYTASETASAGTNTNMSDYSSKYLCSNGLSGIGTVTPSFNVAFNEGVTCTFTNTKLASLTIVKDASPESNQVFNFNFGTGKSSLLYLLVNHLSQYIVKNTSFSLEDTTSGSGAYPQSETFNRLYPGTYYVKESPTNDWFLSNITCSQGVSFLRFGSEILVNISSGAKVVCSYFNEKFATVTVTKFDDYNLNGKYDPSGNPAEPVMSGWSMILTNLFSKHSAQQITGVGAPTGETTFNNVIPGRYQLSEVQQSGWNLSNIYCTNTPLNEEGVGYNFYFGPGAVVNCYVGNYQEASITITKTNNRPNPTTVGDTVAYTLTVTVPKDSGVVFNATVIDTPPANFKVNNSTATAELTRNGITSSLNVPNPDYGSPGTWSLGTLMPGDVVVLTYQAVIQNNVSDGTYPDLAFVTGYDRPNTTSALDLVVGNITNLSSPALTPFVGTLVSIISPLPTSTYTAPKVVGPPELVNTGTDILAAQYILPVLLIGGVIIVSRRSSANKGGK